MWLTSKARGYEGIAGRSTILYYSFYISFKSLSFKDSSYKVQIKMKINIMYELVIRKQTNKQVNEPQ